MLQECGIELETTGTGKAANPSAEGSVKRKRKVPRRGTHGPQQTILGPFWREDSVSKQKRRMGPLPAVAPYFDRMTGRLLRYDVPHVVVDAWCAANDKAPLPRWAYAPLEEKDALNVKKIAARVQFFRKYEQKELPRQQLHYPSTRPPGTVTRTAPPDDHPAPSVHTVRRQLAYLQDRSQLLFLRLEQMYGERYMDATPDQVKTALEGAWEGCNEGLHAIMHGGLLPDLGVVVQYLPLWAKVQDPPFEHDPFIASLRRIFVKSIFQPSKVREIDRSLCNELRDSSASDKGGKFDRRRMVVLLCKLLFCSLAGFYGHAKYTVGYNARRELYRWLSYDIPSVSEMRSWMLDHKLLITFVLREYHIYYMENTPALSGVFAELYEYPSIRTNVLHNMDRVRVRVDVGINNALAVVERFAAEYKGCRSGGVSSIRGIGIPSALLVDIAMLDNNGSSIYYFCKKYAALAEGKLLCYIFWRFTSLGVFDNVAGALGVDAEPHLREVILYWLLLKDCCQHASSKQTKTTYLQCINSIPPDEIVPPLPAKSMAKPMHRMSMVRAREVQHHILAAYRCSCGASAHGMCVLKVILHLVESFDVHRVSRPSLVESPLAYHCIHDRLSNEHFLSRAYTQCLAWCYRPRMTTFADEMVSSFRVVCMSMANYKKEVAVPRKMRGNAELSARFWACKAEYGADERARTREFIRAIITNFPPSREVSVEWMMIAFRITYASVRAVDRARELMLSETNRRAPYNACRQMAITEPRDFWIMRDFFKARFDYESVRAYPLPLDTAQQQVRTLHRKHNVVPVGEPLPASVTTVYYCTEHRAVLAPVVGTEDAKSGYLNTLSIGPVAVSVDVVTGEKYCTTQSHRGDRRAATAALDPDVYAPPTKKAKVSKRCVDKPLSTINMLGRMFQLYGKLYMLCPWCGCVMQYTRGKLTEIGIWCGCCVDGERAMARRLGMPWDEVRQCADLEAVPDSVGGVPVHGHACYHCGQQARRNKPMVYYLLYDDIRTYKITYVPFCDRDQRKWIGTDAGLMRLSNVERNLRARTTPGSKSVFPYDVNTQ